MSKWHTNPLNFIPTGKTTKVESGEPKPLTALQWAYLTLEYPSLDMEEKVLVLTDEERSYIQNFLGFLPVEINENQDLMENIVGDLTDILSYFDTAKHMLLQESKVKKAAAKKEIAAVEKAIDKLRQACRSTLHIEPEKSETLINEWEEVIKQASRDIENNISDPPLNSSKAEPHKVIFVALLYRFWDGLISEFGAEQIKPPTTTMYSPFYTLVSGMLALVNCKIAPTDEPPEPTSLISEGKQLWEQEKVECKNKEDIYANWEKLYF